MKPSACKLALTLLSAHDVCPACGWPASDHPSYPHTTVGRELADAPDGVSWLAIGQAIERIEVGARIEVDASTGRARCHRPGTAPGSSEVETPRPLEGRLDAFEHVPDRRPSLRTKPSRVVRILARALFAIADVLDAP